MKKTLIFFSNPNKLKTGLGIKGTLNNPAYLISKVDSNTTAFLLHDELHANEIKDNLGITKDGDILCVYHKQTSPETLKYLRTINAILVRDDHDAIKYYVMIKDKIKNRKFDIDKIAFDRIWSHIFNFELEESLELFNELNKGIVPEKLSYNIIKHKDEYSKFKTTVKGETDVFSDKYVIALTTLRKAMLGSIKL